ncbi:MAG: electron transport complex subunit RsxE [Sedimentisphaerales bacterium]|nr:electron transport complex subunit RsxE [Sedimentisphaerales bacterium]
MSAEENIKLKPAGASEALSYFVRGLWQENAIFRQMLGMCPVLAVTAQLQPALTMGAATTFVLVCSNIVVSLMRNLLQGHLRILMFTLTIATFVTIADLLLQAFLPDMSEALGAYVPLIIVNCLIIGRAEACGSRKPAITSLCDALGMGIGFTFGLCVLASVREILADGSLWGCRIMPDAFVCWNVMKLPAGAFITLGILLGLSNHFFKKK